MSEIMGALIGVAGAFLLQAGALTFFAGRMVGKINDHDKRLDKNDEEHLLFTETMLKRGRYERI